MGPSVHFVDVLTRWRKVASPPAGPAKQPRTPDSASRQSYVINHRRKEHPWFSILFMFPFALTSTGVDNSQVTAILSKVTCNENTKKKKKGQRTATTQLKKWIRLTLEKFVTILDNFSTQNKNTGLFVFIFFLFLARGVTFSLNNNYNGQDDYITENRGENCK